MEETACGAAEEVGPASILKAWKIRVEVPDEEVTAPITISIRHPRQ